PTRRTSASCRHLDDWVPDGNRLSARPTAATKHYVARNRNVLEPAERPVARRTGRRGPDHRQAMRQPKDADVEEAAYDGANDRRGQYPRQLRHDGGPTRFGSFGRGNKGDRRDRRTRPVSSSYGVPLGSSGTPLNTLAPMSASQPVDAVPGAASESDFCCNTSISSRAWICARRRSASWRSQSRSADSRIASHMIRDERRSPPSVSVTAATDCSHQGAPGTRLARSNQSAAAR